MLRDCDLVSLPSERSSKLSSSLPTSPSYSSTPVKKKNRCETPAVGGSPQCEIPISSSVGCMENQENDPSDPSISRNNAYTSDGVSFPEENQTEEEKSGPPVDLSDELQNDDWDCYRAFSKFFVSSYFGPCTPEKATKQRSLIPEVEWLATYDPFCKKNNPPSCGTNEIEKVENPNDQTKSALISVTSPRKLLLRTKDPSHNDRDRDRDNPVSRPELHECVADTPDKIEIGIPKTTTTNRTNIKDQIEQGMDRNETEENNSNHHHHHGGDANHEGECRGEKIGAKRTLTFSRDEDDRCVHIDSPSVAKECERVACLETRDAKAGSVNFNKPGVSINEALSARVVKNNKNFRHSIPNWLSIRNPLIHEIPNYIKVNGLLHNINYVKIICPIGLKTIFRLKKIITVSVKENDESSKKETTTFFIRMNNTVAFEYVIHTDICLPLNYCWKKIQNLTDDSKLYFIAVVK